MLARESVRARLEGGGISYTEFSYQLLQAMDYLELHRRYGCALQVGGSDQWGNLVSGVDLIGRVEGATVHALATPLITKPDGTKYGKTEGGAIWISPDLMSPYAFYQFWINRVGRGGRRAAAGVHVPDARGDRRARAGDGGASGRPRGSARAGPDVTTLVHGAEEYARAEAASRALFGQGDLEALDEATLAAALDEVPATAVQVTAPLQVVADADGSAWRGRARRRRLAPRSVLSNAGPVQAEPRIPAVSELMARTGIVRANRPPGGRSRRAART